MSLSMFRAFVWLGLALSVPMVAQVPAFNKAGVTMGHHHLMVTSTEAHRKIWVDVLGGTASGNAPLEFVKFPGAFLILSQGAAQSGAAREGSEGSALDHFAFAVKEYEATRDKLAAAGVKIVRDRQEGQREFVAMFPDGIKTEFYEDKSLATPIAHHHIHIMTTDPEAERAWWEKVFGAETRQEGTRKVTEIPGATLAFAKVDPARAKTLSRSLDHTGVGVKNVSEYCAKLAAEGTTCERTAGPNTAIAMVTSPAGVRVEINQGLENR
jgi:catechol 2,3-dioxygenase-like lactoylglutathione lyase family enzyme